MKRVLKYVLVCLYALRKWYVFAVFHVTLFALLYLIVSVIPDSLAACVFAYVVVMAIAIFNAAIVSAIEGSDSFGELLMSEAGPGELFSVRAYTAAELGVPESDEFFSVRAYTTEELDRTRGFINTFK